MRVRFPRPAETMLALAFVGVLIMAGFILTRAFEPPRLTWVALRVVNAPVADRKLIVQAETKRRDSVQCTNGVQADMRSFSGTITRLPAPVRALQQNGDARYELELPENITAGTYGVRLRESFYCSGSPDSAVAPWLEFQVVR